MFDQARSQDFCKGGGHDDGATEGPERGAEARSAGRSGEGRRSPGAVAPPQYGGLGA